MVIVEARVVGRPGVTIERSWPGLGEAASMGEILEVLVRDEVVGYAERQATQSVCHVLTPADMVTGVAAGRITSGGRPAAAAPPVEEAVERAHQAFRDGLVLAVLDGQQVDDLDERLVLTDSSRLRLVRLVALAGG